MQSDPADRVSVERVSENDKGMVLRGRLGMHTSPAYAEDIWVGTLTGLTIDGHPVGFIVPVNAPGVTILCRKVATRDRDPCRSPLSARYDELDGQMWLDNVFIPWERVFAVDPEPEAISALVALASPPRLAGQGRVYPRFGASTDGRHGTRAERGHRRISRRSHSRGADRALLHHRRRA